MTRLAWLRRGATAATPEVLKAELAKLEFLRGHGADRLDLSALPAGRRRMLAETGRRSTNRALQRADVDRRYPILLATLAETYVEVLDELLVARHAGTVRSGRGSRVEVDRGRLLRRSSPTATSTSTGNGTNSKNSAATTSTTTNNSILQPDPQLTAEEPHPSTTGHEPFSVRSGWDRDTKSPI